MHRFCICLVLGLLIVAVGAAPKRKNELPAAARAVLAKGSHFELLSLDPDERNAKGAKEKFHDWKVLGKTVVKSKAARRRILAAVLKGVADHPRYAAKCFNPRHGIRATLDGRTVDLVICFECYQIEMFEGNEELGDALTNRKPQPVLDKVLKAAGVPLATKAKK
jgi:hypothetical protein